MFCRNPLNLTYFYAIQTPIVWHILGAYFSQIWGVGVVRIIFNLVFAPFTGSPRFGSVRLRFGGGTVRAVPFSVPAVPLQKAFVCVSVEFNRKGRFRFRFRFLENGSCGSGSAFGFGKNGSDGSSFRFRFGS